MSAPIHIDINKRELTALIRDGATREKPLPLVFGPGYVAITTGQPGSLAALQKLAELRGIRLG